MINEMLYIIETYGCQMNVHESEKLAGILKNAGYAPAERLDDASVVVFNTCCIRDTAEKRALGNIGAVKALKRARPEIVVCVVGCMTQQEGYDALIKKQYGHVDVVLGTANLHLLAEKVEAVLAGRKKQFEIDQSASPDLHEETPIARTSFPNAWVNIMYGCDNFCSYCIVPFVRGRERSREKQAIVAEIRGLVAEGYKEITLLGQNVNSFKDADGGFYGLLSDVAMLAGDFRVRFMTSHPKDLSQKVVEVIAASDKLCNNIHLPAQAGSDRILALMNRGYTAKQYLETVDMIRGLIPDCGITSDLMVGFPTETEAEFEETLALARRARFANAFTFVYSVRKGTKAAAMEQLPYPVKQDRIKRLIALQNAITKENGAAFLGKAYKVLADGINDKNGLLVGKTDCGRQVSFAGGGECVGKFVNVRITSAKSASLAGEIIL